MTPIPAVSHKFANIRDAAFTSCVFPQGLTLGDRMLRLDDQRPRVSDFHSDHMSRQGAPSRQGPLDCEYDATLLTIRSHSACCADAQSTIN